MEGRGPESYSSVLALAHEKCTAALPCRRLHFDIVRWIGTMPPCVRQTSSVNQSGG